MPVPSDVSPFFVDVILPGLILIGIPGAFFLGLSLPLKKSGGDKR